MISDQAGAVDLIFSKEEFIVPTNRPFTPEVERYLVQRNNDAGQLLVAWKYIGRRTYHFTFCSQTDTGDETMLQQTEQGLTVTPWQVFSWADPSTQIFIPSGHDFRTIRLAEEYELMAAGDHIEFIRMGDMVVLGEAEVISTKRTILKYVEEQDIADFRRVVGGRGNTDNPLQLLSQYYETPLLPSQTVIIMHLRAVTSIISSDDLSDPSVNTASVGAVIRSTLTKPVIRGI
jgi:hypothetical protein